MSEEQANDPRDEAMENVAHFMAAAEGYTDELGIEEMDRTQFLGLFAQACVLDMHLSAIRTELKQLTDSIYKTAE